ncbi:hypothetical protein [Bradyrhizobium arachidis]|uniref:Uncharacterized protein n=1 Tax=Bradyrhizobium arachidis TaxID=858423 RepID=A0AAE7THV3_9BRAD|nr:hypothetical protein [Bradyrhizobium arachidis]QOZ68890.1 hypothetical protein WN72_23095 [Bradyrhizobium arachidis]SFV19433.1 hypothetical protein SAMN05192541_15114 [Bradyrhizobium arachidis]
MPNDCVTDPALLAQLNAPVTDPAVLAQLNSRVTDQETLDQLNKEKRPRTSAVEAGARGAAEGVTLNFYDELRGLMEAGGVGEKEAGSLYPLLKGVVKYFSGDEEARKRYDEAVRRERELSRQAFEDQPAASIAGNVVGGAVLPGGSLLRGATTGQRILRGAAAGAGYGGLSGVGAGKDTESRLRGGAFGAGLGGVLGGTLGGAFGARPAPATTGREVAEAADRLGVAVPRGLLSDSVATQATTQAARQLPIIGGRAERAVAGANQGLEDVVGEAAGRFGVPGGSRADVGAQTRTAVEAGIERIYDRANDAFAQLRTRHIDADAPVQLSNDLLGTFENIVRERVAAGDTGIPIQKIESALELLTRPGGASFNGLQRARTEMGKAISWDERNGGFMAADLKRAYGALSDAMEEAVRTSARGNADDAVRALDRANATWANVTGEGRTLQRFLSQGSDERIVDRIMSFASNKAGSGDIARLNLLRRSMQPQEWNSVAANVVQRMGLNNAGDFSPAFFINKYQNMTQASRDMLFGATGTQTRRYIDDIAAVSQRMRDTSRFANSSNTARAGLLGAGGVTALAAAYNDPIDTAQKGLLIGGVAVPIAALLTNRGSAASMARWSMAYENLIRRPSAAAVSAFNIASRNLGHTVSKATGTQVDPDAFAQAVRDQHANR